MNPTKLTLALEPDTYAVCRLDPHVPIPNWAYSGEFNSVTRTQNELSIVCLQRTVPSGIKYESDWRCLRVEGTLDFTLTGILASLAAPLAEAGISIFSISTFDTDYILVKERDLEHTIAVLQQAGHSVQTAYDRRNPTFWL